VLETGTFGGTLPLVLGRFILCVDTVTFATEFSVTMLVEVLCAAEDAAVPAIDVDD
jgi:hypothetical protein